MTSAVRILVGTPCRQDGLTPEYVHTMEAFRAHCEAQGWHLQVEMRPDGLVTRSRNIFASRVARDESFTHLLMVDADIGFTADVADRLIRSGRDVVGACVPLRETAWPRVRRALDDLPGVEADELASLSHGYAVSFLREPLQQAPEGFLPVRFLGGALMVVTRQALQQLAASDQVRRYAHGGVWKDWPDDGWTFFDPTIDPTDGTYLSEDYAFCLRWRSIGGSVHADLRSPVTHSGRVSIRGDIGVTVRSTEALVRARSVGGRSEPAQGAAESGSTQA